MPLDAISMTRLGAGHPELSKRIQQLAQLCEADGVTFRVTMVLRSYNEQAALYAQGRQDLATVNEMRGAVNWAPITENENEEVVTHAAAGQSAHNFGYAADIVPDLPGSAAFSPDWNELDPAWKDVLNKATMCGLAEGAQWTAAKRDYPHLYLQELPADPTSEMQQTFKDGGLVAVFAMIDQALSTAT